MTPNDLISDVAVAYLKGQIAAEPEGALRFCMIGLGSGLVTEVARAALADSELQEQLDVRVPRELADEGVLPKSVVTDEAAARWRNIPLSSPKKRGVLFAVSNDELQRIGKTAETLPKLETAHLRELYNEWINGTGLAGDRLQDKERTRLLAALTAVNQAHAARTIEIFASYVLATAHAVDAGLPVEQALDYALPALQLPRNAGRFRDIAEARKAEPAEWRKKYRFLHSRIRPLLVRENVKGESIGRLVRDNLVRLREEYEEYETSAVDTFLDSDLSPDSWREPQQQLAELDWQRIKDLFEGTERTRQQTLGKATAEYFDDNFPDDINDDDREYLNGALSPAPKEPPQEAVNFFDVHRERLARNKKLYGRWERYIYRNPDTYGDFLEGLVATLHRLRDMAGEMSERPCLVVRIPRSRQKDFWRRKNATVMRFFAQRYHGISRLFGDRVEIDFGRLAEYYLPEADAELRKSTSTSKEARSLKFEVELDPDLAKEKLIFFWELNANAVPTALPDDLQAVANLQVGSERALMTTAAVARQAVSAKGQIQRIALEDATTLKDVEDGNKGTLVAPNRPEGDLYERFLVDLDLLRGKGALDADSAGTVRDSLEKFLACYTRAIRDWVAPDGLGIASEELIAQAEAYGELLAALRAHADNDLSREKLWTHALRVGIAHVGGGTEAAIVTPWQPLRLAEIHVKARQTAELIEQVLDATDEEVYRADLFFSQRGYELRSAYYPDVCLGLRDGKPDLLAASDSLGAYTLAEPPRRDRDRDVDDALDIEPGVAARCFAAVAEQYLDLLPHERSNFSVVLYNAESKALPKALANELSSKVEQESDLRCDLLLTHSDVGRMRSIYEQQNVAVAEDGGSVLASEAARNFLSRLRVGFLDATAVPSDDTARAADIVFLQDVVARHADIVWKRAPSQQAPELREHVPARWSRRRPISRGETSAAVYLAAPVQPRACQAYLNALYRVIEGGTTGLENVIPAREIGFRDAKVDETFHESHRIGEWVVNFDELVDRRLLEQKNIKVIRHIHDRAVDRNIVVSTTSELQLLRVLIQKRLENIDHSLGPESSEQLTHDLIARAARLSGQIVMRAARYGHYANELLGLVLSMTRLTRALGGTDRHTGWYFLDDFASWFGQREEQIADIMAIAPRVEDDAPILTLAITESKFVGSQGYQTHKKKSARQLAETVARLTRALHPDKRRIDREAWLHRIGDLMLEGMEPFDDAPVADWNLQRWSEETRADRVPIRIVGFSHVFVHDNEAPVDATDPVPVRGLDNCFQVVVDASGVRGELRALAEGASSAPPPAEAEEGWRGALVSRRPRVLSRAPDSKAGEQASESRTPEQTEGETEEVETEAGTAPGSSPRPKTTTAPDRPLAAPECTWPSNELREWIAAGAVDLSESEANRQWLRDCEKALQRALRGYEMTAELRGSRLTPNAALVRFRGTDDLTVAKVEKRRQELLTSHAIKVINVLPAPGEVVVMVERPERNFPRLQDLWRQRMLPGTAPESNMSLLLGAKEADGEMLYLNVGEAFQGHPQHGPHTLIAGETGSGKGVLVQNLLLDIAATNSPQAARIWMIDPKAGVDYPWLRRMPHLEGEVVTEQAVATEVFAELVARMEERNRILAGAGVSKLAQYNRRVGPEKRMPVIWLFHDELADWMLIDDYRDAVETSVTRLGVKARAAGIHLVLVTQRPDKDALPMQLRANLSNRLVLKVADKRNSELVLDEAGAERLLGKGHLAAKLTGEGGVILAQVPFVDEDETLDIAEMIALAWSSSDSSVR